MAEHSKHAPRPAKRSTRAILEEHAPWKPVHYETADILAIQALQAGTAEDHQQRRAFRWIVEAASALYDLAYRPGGEEGRRDTDFALGRAFVGSQIMKLTRLNTMNATERGEQGG